MSHKQEPNFSRFKLPNSSLLGARDKIAGASKLKLEEATPAEKPERQRRNSTFENLLIQLILAQATILARAGRYAEAEQLLTGLPDEQEAPAALDLHARICAQQGRWSEAREHWERALQLDATNEAYAAGLLRLEAEQSDHHSRATSPFSQDAARIAATLTGNDLLLAQPRGNNWRYEIVPDYMVRRSVRGGGYDYLLYRLARRLADYVEANHLGMITCSQAGYDVASSGEQSILRVPDLAFVRTERLPAAGSPAWFRPWKLVPDLVAELVTEQQNTDHLISSWLECGVQVLWIIRATSKTIDVWSQNTHNPLSLGIKETLQAEILLPGFTCPLEDIFSFPQPN